TGRLGWKPGSDTSQTSVPARCGAGRCCYNAGMNLPQAATAEQLPLTLLKGVGPQLAVRLQQLGIHTLLDLLFHLPLRYQDRTRLTPIAALRHGDDVVIEGNVASCAVVFGRRR